MSQDLFINYSLYIYSIPSSWFLLLNKQVNFTNYFFVLLFQQHHVHVHRYWMQIASKYGMLWWNKGFTTLQRRYNNLNEQYRSKVEEGLSKFLAFLREEEERERLEEIERLKPIGTQVRNAKCFLQCNKNNNNKMEVSNLRPRCVCFVTLPKILIMVLLLPKLFAYLQYNASVLYVYLCYVSSIWQCLVSIQKLIDNRKVQQRQEEQEGSTQQNREEVGTLFRKNYRFIGNKP